MKKESICPNCESKLTKLKKDNIFSCKNKDCLKQYTETELNQENDLKRKKLLLDNSLKELLKSEKFINESNISKHFNIGDKVNTLWGNKDLTVIDVKDNKFYLVQGTELSWYRYHNLYLATTKECNEVFNKRSENVNKRIQFSNRRLDGILHYYYHSRLNLNPEYQRDFVWKDEHKEKLIDSIFMGKDIGKLIFIRLPYESDSFDYEILDGKQRLKTLIDFIEDKISYKGYLFSQLSQRDKSEFLNTLIAVGETDEGFTEKDKIQYFLLVNDTGVPQEKEFLDKLKEKLK